MPKRTALIWLYVVCLAGAALRSYRLTDRSLWFDESASYMLIAGFPWGEMIERIKVDVHPPLYFCLLRLWTDVFGTSEEALRSLSVLLGVGTLAAIYLVTRDLLLDPRLEREQALAEARPRAVLAAALLAVSSSHIQWSQQARMYALGTLLAALSTWFLFRGLRSTARGWAWWSGYALTAAAFLYTHNFALFTVFAQALFLAGYVLVTCRFRPGRIVRSGVLWQSAGSLCAAAALYSPWAQVLQDQKREVKADFWIGPVTWRSLPDAWLDLLAPLNTQWMSYKWLSVSLFVLSGLMLIVFVCRLRAGHWLIAALIVVPLVCAVVVSVVSVPIVLARYFLFSHEFLACAVADLVFRWFRGTPRRVVIALLIGGSLWGHSVFWRGMELDSRPGLKGAIQHLGRHNPYFGPILVLHPYIFFATKYYLPPRASPKLYFPSGPIPHYLGGALATPRDIVGYDYLKGIRSNRVWVLDTTGYSFGFSPFRLPDDWHEVPNSKASFTEVFFFQKNVTVTQYQRSSAPVAPEGPDSGKPDEGQGPGQKPPDRGQPAAP